MTQSGISSIRTKTTCPECGKTFLATAEWGYGIGETDYCSWRCVRATERKMAAGISDLDEEKPKVNRQKLNEEQVQEILTMREQGATLLQIRLQTGHSTSCIQKYLKTIRQENMDMDEKVMQTAEQEQPKETAQQASVPAETGPARPRPGTDRRKTWKAIGALEAIFKADLFDDHKKIAEAALAVIEEALT